MNFIYFGLPSDYNIGNGKTVSCISKVVDTWILDESRSIFSNIKLHHVPYEPLTPDNLEEVLETENALVVLDEVHAIIHKKHMVTESCKKHAVTGLCYRLSEFMRQVRKRKIDTHSTAQDFYDVHYQMRVMMQVGILCEKFHIENGNLVKCQPDRYPGSDCPEDHEHWIKQTNMRTGTKTFLDPQPYYNMYDSFEIVQGWVSYD